MMIGFGVGAAATGTASAESSQPLGNIDAISGQWFIAQTRASPFSR